MVREQWKDILEGVGIIAIIASLIFVGLQIQQDRSIAQAEMSTQYADSQIELSRLISEHSEIWIRGLDDEELSPTERLQFDEIVYAVEQKQVARIIRAGRVGPLTPERVARRFAHELHKHKGLRRSVLEHCRYRAEASGSAVSTCDLFVKYLAQYDSGELRPSDRTNYIF